MGFNIVKAVLNILNESSEYERQQQEMIAQENQRNWENYIKMNLSKTLAEAFNKVSWDINRKFTWETFKIDFDSCHNNFVAEIPDADEGHASLNFLRKLEKNLAVVFENTSVSVQNDFNETLLAMSNETDIENRYWVFFRENFYHLILVKILNISWENSCLIVTFDCSWTLYWKFHPQNILQR